MSAVARAQAKFRKAYRPGLYEPGNGNARLLLGGSPPAAAPFVPVAIANPRGPKADRPSLYEPGNGRSQLLLDAAPPAAAPFVPAMLANPQARLFPAGLRGFQHWTANPVALATVPFAQPDWPNPVTRKRGLPLDGSSGLPLTARIRFSYWAWSTYGGLKMIKNASGQKISLFVVNTSTNLPMTGDAANLTFYVNKDDGGVTALADTTPSEDSATNSPGTYTCDLAQAETNGTKLVFSGKSSTPGVRVVPQVVYPEPDIYLGQIDAQLYEEDEDRYTITWTKNGEPITSGVTVPLISVRKWSDGTLLINGQTMTEIGTTEGFKWAEPTNRMGNNEAALVICTATIDGATRTARHPIKKPVNAG